MRYRKVIPGVFLQRPNRFIAYCEIDGNVEKCLSRTLGNAISSTIGVESRNGAVLWLKKHKTAHVAGW